MEMLFLKEHTMDTLNLKLWITSYIIKQDMVSGNKCLVKTTGTGLYKNYTTYLVTLEFAS